MNLEIRTLSGINEIRVYFIDTKYNSNWFLTKEVDACAKIGSPLHWLSEWSMSIQDAKTVRDKLTKAIILAELSSDPLIKAEESETQSKQ